MDLSGCILAVLHQDAEFVLCRGRAKAGPTPYPTSVLVSIPTSEHPNRIRMLERELALRPSSIRRARYVRSPWPVSRPSGTDS
jgi:hypothetical protein